MQVLQGQYCILSVLFIERGNSVLTFASFCSQNYAAILISLPPCTKYGSAVVGGRGGGGGGEGLTAVARGVMRHHILERSLENCLHIIRF